MRSRAQCARVAPGLARPCAPAPSAPTFASLRPSAQRARPACQPVALPPSSSYDGPRPNGFKFLKKSWTRDTSGLLKKEGEGRQGAKTPSEEKQNLRRFSHLAPSRLGGSRSLVA